jgi:hypothetical protein
MELRGGNTGAIALVYTKQFMRRMEYYKIIREGFVVIA